MRKSKAEMAVSRAHILAEASHLFRERGPERVSVADVMQAAGMTHGGFYKHFTSKDALLAAAIRQSFLEKLQLLSATSGEEAAAKMHRYVARYLTLEHLDDLANGCPIAGLTGDAVRADAAVSAALAEGAEATIAAFADAMADEGDAAAGAIRALTAIIGAVILARAVAKPDLKRKILQVALDEVAGGA